MVKKLDQKLINIVKEKAMIVLYLVTEEEGQQTYSFDVPSHGKFKKIVVGIISNNPYSEFFSHYSVSTGMQDRHLELEDIKFAKIEANNGKSEVAYVGKEMAVEREQIVIETNGVPTTEVLIVNIGKIGLIGDFLNESDYDRKDVILEGTAKEVIGDHSVWKVGSRTASQTRKGDLVVIPHHKAMIEHMESDLGFNLSSYAESYDEEKLGVSTKIQSRIKMSASSGKEFPLFKGFKYLRTYVDIFKGVDDQDVRGDVYVFQDGKEERKILVLREDFEVRLKQKIMAPDFNKDGSYEFIEKEQVFVKPATDGSSYLDMSYAYLNNLFFDQQIRIVTAIKGMLNLTYKLEERLGYVAVLFGGAVKGDPAPFFKESDLTTYILGEARPEIEREDNFLLASNQLVRELGRMNPKVLDVLEYDTYNLMSKTYKQNIEALKIFIGLDENEDNLNKVLDSENVTVNMFNANPGVFLRSDSFRRRLSDFIRPASREVEYAGRYYSKDNSFRHMVSDPYEVIRHLENGRIGIDTLISDDMQGIAPEHIITNGLVNGQYKLDDRKAVLGRFPMLHNKEVQVVNISGSTFLDIESAQNYESLMANNHHQGLVIYSLYDMVAEAQSGADYDGDTSTVNRNPEITCLLDSQDKYLDYSFLEGELVEGVPWKEDLSQTLTSIIGKDKVAFLESKGVEYNEGHFVFDESLIEDDNVREVIYESITRLDGMSNKGNNIGQITNINSAVSEMIVLLKEKLSLVIAKGVTDLANKIQTEINGYENLNLMLASAIRWEIDKAKHGGRFYEELGFLDILMKPGKEVPENKIRNIEEKYNISMLRLFAQYNKVDDSINKSLIELEILPIHLERGEFDDSNLNGSRTISLGKGIDKGADYKSRYSTYIEKMNQLALRETVNSSIYEYKNGLLDEATGVIEYMKNTHDLEYDLESMYQAKMAIEEGKGATNPVRLLFSYRKQMREVSELIQEKEFMLLRILNEEKGGQVLNANSLGLESLMKKVNVPEEERKEAYKLLALKELIIDEHKGLGESFTPSDPNASVLLFAELYSMNIRSQNSSRAEALKNTKVVDELKHKWLNFLGKEYFAKYGNKKPSQETALNVNKWIDEKVKEEIYNDTGWGSIITLFPLGAVQFLEFLHDKVLTTSAKGKNAVVYMELSNGGLIPNQIKQALKGNAGKRIVIDESVWGAFIINKEDVAGRNRQVNMSDRELANIEDITRYTELKEMRFERGAHLWNRKRDGRIVHISIYDTGVKLYLEDSSEIA